MSIPPLVLKGVKELTTAAYANYNAMRGADILEAAMKTAELGLAKERIGSFLFVYTIMDTGDGERKIHKLSFSIRTRCSTDEGWNVPGWVTGLIRVPRADMMKAQEDFPEDPTRTHYVIWSSTEPIPEPEVKTDPKKRKKKKPKLRRKKR